MSSSRSSSPASAASESPSQGTSPKPAAAEARDKASPAKSSESDSDSDSDREHGEISESEEEPIGPSLPNEPVPDATATTAAATAAAAGGDGGAPPLPNEPIPEDGWDYRWDYNLQTYIFFNHFTGAQQLENPRVPTGAPPAPVPTAAAVTATTAATTTTTDTAPPPLPAAPPAVDPTTIDPEDRSIGGYNPAIHGSYDPNAWYAKLHEPPEEDEEEQLVATDPSAVEDPFAVTASFNRFTGQFQTGDQGPTRHSDEAKSRRQMNAFFDVDAAANAHNGRSLKAERSGKKPSKAELKAFKEKRRAKKEEKRRAWLRD